MREQIEKAFQEMEIPVATDGTHFVHTTEGRYAPKLNTVVSVDEDGMGATIMTALEEAVPTVRRSAVYELLNLVHGQGLWNVRFHLDENGRVFSIGKFSLWGKPFNATQFGDIFFTLLVTTDRIHPPLKAILAGDKPVDEAFELFFLKNAAPEKNSSPSV